MSDELDRMRREMHAVLQQPGVRPDNSLKITRRTFIHRSLLFGAATVAQTFAWWPLINTIDVAHAAEAPFKFAWISDTHLYPKSLNTRFVDKTVRAAKEVQAMDPPADFLIFGGDLAQLGKVEELELGIELLKEVKIRKVFIPGEHDWYLDMGKKWGELFGQPNWTFDHKGVRFIGLDTVSRGPDYWTAKKMTPEERMGHMSALDGTVAGPWAGVGREQLDWMEKTLADWDKAKPVIIFSHNPLYEYYPPWNFWVRDWRDVHEVLKPYTKVTNIHGHVHQVLYNEIGTMRSIGMLATSWPWPYAPEGVPKLTKPMIRVDPGDPFDGVGWGKMSVSADDKVDTEYVMWGRKEVFVQSPEDYDKSIPEVIRPRIADNMYPWAIHEGGMAMTTRSTFLGLCAALPRGRSVVAAAVLVGPASAHKDPVTPQQLKAYQEAFMERGQEGRPAVPWRRRDREDDGRHALDHRHGLRDVPSRWPPTPTRTRSRSSRRRSAKFATLRDMINWCIEKPNQGEKIDADFGRDEGPGSLHLLVEHRLGAGAGQVLGLPARRGGSSASDRGAASRTRRRRCSMGRAATRAIARLRRA